MTNFKQKGIVLEKQINLGSVLDGSTNINLKTFARQRHGWSGPGVFSNQITYKPPLTFTWQCEGPIQFNAWFSILYPVTVADNAQWNFDLENVVTCNLLRQMMNHLFQHNVIIQLSLTVGVLTFVDRGSFTQINGFRSLWYKRAPTLLQNHVTTKSCLG